MSKKRLMQLSRRERQIMDIIYRRGTATAAEVRKEIDEPPSYSAVRALLRVLEEKGYVRHRQQGPRYLYSPTLRRDLAKNSALKHVMQTFFDNSTENVVAALMDMSGSQLSETEYRRLQKLIKEARRGGGKK